MLNAHSVVCLLLVCCIQIGLSSLDQAESVNCDLKTWYMDALAEGLFDDNDEDSDESKAEVKAEVLRLVRRKKGLVYVDCAQLEHFGRTLRQTESVKSAQEAAERDRDMENDSTDIDTDYDSLVPHSESNKFLDDEGTTENDPEASETSQKEHDESIDDGVELTEQSEQNVEEGNRHDSERKTSQTINDEFHEDKVQSVMKNSGDNEDNKDASVTQNDPAEELPATDSFPTFPTSEPNDNSHSSAEDRKATNSVRPHESDNDFVSNEYLRRVEFYESLQFVKESKSGYCILTRAEECWITPRRFQGEGETTQSLRNKRKMESEVDTIQNDIDGDWISEKADDTLLTVENFEGSEEIAVPDAEQSEDNNAEESNASDVSEQGEDKDEETLQIGQNTNEQELNRSGKTEERTGSKDVDRSDRTGKEVQPDATITKAEEGLLRDVEETQSDKFIITTENKQDIKPGNARGGQKDLANNAKNSETVHAKRNQSRDTKNSDKHSTIHVKSSHKDSEQTDVNVNANKDISKNSNRSPKKATDTARTTQKTHPQKAKDVQNEVEGQPKSIKKGNVTNKKPIPKSGDENVENNEKVNPKNSDNTQEDSDKTIENSQEGNDKTIENSQEGNDKNIENSQEGSDKTIENIQEVSDKNIDNSQEGNYRNDYYNQEKENLKEFKKLEEENAETVGNTVHDSDGQTTKNTIKVKSALSHKGKEEDVVENAVDTKKDQTTRAKELGKDSAGISQHKHVSDVDTNGKTTSEAINSIIETSSEAVDSVRKTIRGKADSKSETTLETADPERKTTPETVDFISETKSETVEFNSKTTSEAEDFEIEAVTDTVDSEGETPSEEMDPDSETTLKTIDFKNQISSDEVDVVSRKTSESSDGTLSKGGDLSAAGPSEVIDTNHETTPVAVPPKNATQSEDVGANKVPDSKEINAHKETAPKEEAANGTVDADANSRTTSDGLETRWEAMPEAADADSEGIDSIEEIGTIKPNDRLSDFADSNTDSKKEVVFHLKSEQINTAYSSDHAAASSHDAFKAEDNRETYNKLLNEWFLSVEQRYTDKIQSLELQISRMENHLLGESFDVESKTSAIDQLENHILRLENEILRFNQTFRDLQSEHERLLQNQKTQIQEIGSYKELAELNSSKKNMNSGSSCLTAVEEQQNKIKQLSEMIQKQSSLFEKLQDRFHQVEGDNHHLVKQILNQSVLLNKVLMRMDTMNQEQEWHKKKLKTVQQSCERNSKSYATKMYDGESQTQREDNLDILIGRKSISTIERVQNRESIERPLIPQQMLDKQEANDAMTNLDENGFKPTLLSFLAKEEGTSSSPSNSINIEYPESLSSEEIYVQTGEESADLKYKVADQGNFKNENIKNHELEDALNELIERGDDESKPENVEDIKLVDANFVLPKAKNSDEAKEQNEENDAFKDTSDEFRKIKSDNSIKESESRGIEEKVRQAEAEEKPQKSESEESDKPGIDEQLPAEKDPVTSSPRPISKSSQAKSSKESIREEPSVKSESPKSESIIPKQTKPKVNSNANMTPSNSQSTAAARNAKLSDKVPPKDKEKPAKSLPKPQESVLNAFPDPPIYAGKSKGEFKDCYDHYTKGRRHNTPLKISPGPGNKAIEVYCDMKNGGWTVIQRRQDGSVDFYRNWNEYKNGFGSVYGEHWVGNEIIHLLTNQDHYSLRVELTDWDRNTHLIDYDRFRISNEADGFRIFVAGYEDSPAGDSLTKHHGNRFSTMDVDNDLVEKEFDGNCARRFSGAWWYYKCYKSNLNGKYYRGGSVDDNQFDGVAWKSWTGSKYSLKKVEMKIRPRTASKS